MNAPISSLAADRGGGSQTWHGLAAHDAVASSASDASSGLAGRLAALLVYYALAPFALPALGCFTPNPLLYATRLGPRLTTEQTPAGALLVRRRVWLREIVLGRMNWIGPLPRTQEQLDALPRRARQIIAAQPPGILALSDLRGASATEHPDEWAHALRQCSMPREEQRRLVFCHLRHWLSPNPSQ